MGKVYDQIGLVKANISLIQTALNDGDHKRAIQSWKLAKNAYDVYLTAKKDMSGKTKLGRSRQTKLNDMATFESAYNEFKKNWGTDLDELDQMLRDAADQHLQEQFRLAREKISVVVNSIDEAVATFDATYDNILQKTPIFRQAIDKEFEQQKSKLVVAGNAQTLKKRLNRILQAANPPKYLNVVTRSSKVMAKEATKLNNLKTEPRDKSPEATALKNDRNRVAKAITSTLRKGQKVIAQLNGWTTYVQAKEKLVDQEEERLLQMGSEGR